ncbi:T9SS type A sorting domain-containing protein [Cryomorphaceae bacterium 1068]|nr:T9SS type A sorting domain-containing protein [Cryomorphaceae bacterium 1068]
MKRIALLIFVLLSFTLHKIEAQGIDSLNLTSTYITLGESWYTDYYTNYSVYTNRSFFKDENDGLHMVFISNYKLIYCFSSDYGSTWSTDEISTDLDGTYKLAVIYADAEGNPYIAATVNPHFNYGNPTNIDYSEEFRFDVHFLFKDEGDWVVENVYTSNASNYGMEVSELYMDQNGDLVLIGNRFGWWTYGGAIYELTRSEGVWSDLNIIHEFSEASDNHFTFLSYSVLNINGTRDIIFCRYSYNIQNPELLSIHYDGENWSEPNSITGDLHHYVSWSMTTDTDGGSWLAYFSNDPTPQISLSIGLEDPIEMDIDLSLVDTIQSIKLHYLDYGFLDLIVNPLNSDTALLYVSEDYGVTWGEPIYADNTLFAGVLPTRDQFSNQTTDLEFMSVSRVSQVEPYGPDSLFYNHLDQIDSSTLGIDDYGELSNKLSVYPNPFSDIISLNCMLEEPSELNVRIFTLQGKMIAERRYQGNIGDNQISMNLGFLDSGTYIIEVLKSDQTRGNLQKATKKLVKL